jgi:hypothetical protein
VVARSASQEIESRSVTISESISTPSQGLSVDVAPFARTLIRGLFGVTILLSVALVKWNVAGIPVRSMTAVLLLLVVAAFRLDVIAASIRESWTLLCIIALAALIGTISSAMNSNDPAFVARQLVEIHVQAMVGTIVGVSVRRTCGARTILAAFAVGVGLSALAAVLQFMDIGLASSARRFLNSFQQQEVQKEFFFSSENRPAGLSYTAVLLGTQLCLLFATIYADRLRTLGEGLFRRPDAALLLTLPLLAGASIASGNRSPLLGMICFAILYFWFAQRRTAIFLIAIAIAAYPIVLMLPELLRGLGLRVGETEDSSAVGRVVLQVYGLMLFAARPYGYGLAFDSTEHWLGFWAYLKGFDNAQAITWHALHNYYLMVINKYGVPILLVGIFVVRILARYRWAALGFVPYLIHICFHNDGPLQGDFFIWYVIPMFAGTARLSLRRPDDLANSGGAATRTWHYSPSRNSQSSATPLRSGTGSVGTGRMANE